MIERTLAGLHASLADRLPQDLNRRSPVLDIGCGSGAWLQRLGDSGFTDLNGIDRETDQFQYVDARCARCDIDTEWPILEGRRFGLITAIEVIEHLENPGRLLAMVAACLADDGYFLMTTPNIHSLLCRFRFFVTGKLKQFDSKGDPTHIYPVLLTALRRTLPRCQLEISRLWWYPEDGHSVTSRKSLKLAVALLRRLMPDDIPGDLLCLLIRKTSAVALSDVDRPHS